MTHAELFELMNVAVGQVDAIDADAELAELGLDSLAVLEVFAAIEQRFAVRIPDDEIGALRTPRAITDYVTRLQGGA